MRSLCSQPLLTGVWCSHNHPQAQPRGDAASACPQNHFPGSPSLPSPALAQRVHWDRGFPTGRWYSRLRAVCPLPVVSMCPVTLAVSFPCIILQGWTPFCHHHCPCVPTTAGDNQAGHGVGILLTQLFDSLWFALLQISYLLKTACFSSWRIPFIPNFFFFFLFFIPCDRVWEHCYKRALCELGPHANSYSPSLIGKTTQGF